MVEMSDYLLSLFFVNSLSLCHHFENYSWSISRRKKMVISQEIPLFIIKVGVSNYEWPLCVESRILMKRGRKRERERSGARREGGMSEEKSWWIGEGAELSKGFFFSKIRKKWWHCDKKKKEWIKEIVTKRNK